MSKELERFEKTLLAVAEIKGLLQEISLAILSAETHSRLANDIEMICEDANRQLDIIVEANRLHDFKEEHEQLRKDFFEVQRALSAQHDYTKKEFYDAVQGAVKHALKHSTITNNAEEQTND